MSCQEGYIGYTGSKIVTCNTYLYQDFQYHTEPKCNTPSTSEPIKPGKEINQNKLKWKEKGSAS